MLCLSLLHTLLMCRQGMEGCIYALFNCRNSQANSATGSRHAASLSINKSDQLQKLATAAGFGFCEGRTKVGPG